MDLKTLKETPPWDWPADTGHMLLAVLQDDHASKSDRLLAAELAGDYTVVNNDLAAALLSVVWGADEPENLRGQAAISLGPALEHADTDGFDDPDDMPISEQTFHAIQESLQSLYLDTTVPKDVRRRILEASVRAPQDWHPEAVRAACSSDDEAWRLTAVFCMKYLRGFDDQIVEALASENPDIQYEAVVAAGNWAVDAAWPDVAELITTQGTDKPLLLAAIEAAASIRPQDAVDLLGDLTDSQDEDIVDAAYEALAMAQGTLEAGEDDEDEED